MTNAEWKELVAKEFGVSKSVARDMVSAMYSVYRCKKPLWDGIWIGNYKDYNAICEMSGEKDKDDNTQSV